MTLGSGTAAATELRGFIEEVEAIRERKKQLADIEKEIMARAKAQGFDTKTIRAIVRDRAKEADKREEEQTLYDTYAHALGMAEEAPIHAVVASIGEDILVKEEVVETLKKIVPINGEIILKCGGVPIRIWRNDRGFADAEEVVERPPSVKPGADDDDDEHPDRFPRDVTSPRKSHVMSAADRAEAAAAAKKPTA